MARELDWDEPLLEQSTAVDAGPANAHGRCSDEVHSGQFRWSALERQELRHAQVRASP